MGFLRLPAAALFAVSGLFLTPAAGAPTPTEISLTIQNGAMPIAARVSADLPNVGAALEALGIATDRALVVPSPETALAPELSITLFPKYDVRITDGDQPSRLITTYAATVGGALEEAGVSVSLTDSVKPDLTTPTGSAKMITVTRIVEREEERTVSVPFPVHAHDDATLPWGEEHVIRTGQLGKARETVRMRFENGRAASERVLSREILEQPVAEERVRGTLIRIGKTLEGRGSWYSFRKGNYAAATAFPRGSWLRVTNLENKKAVIIQVNDYGPFIPGRIIDLEITAFRQLAPTGQGVIPVRVEQIIR